MGSKKHKKHHKSDKKDVSFEGERQEKPLKLVLKVAGSSSSIQSQTPPHATSLAQNSGNEQLKHTDEHKSRDDKEKSGHSHEKHKKSKKKKKKKSSEKDKDRHEKKRKHHHHHHHRREHSHERKEKRKREQHDISRTVIDTQEECTALQKSVLMETQVVSSVDKPLRDARTCTLKKKALKTPLQILLYYMLKKLQMKDPEEFFAWPVTDSIAPGYSTIIQSPTDFSTIKKNIDDRVYKSVSEFKNAIKLMCDNAMTYNRSDTIYYRSARKMLHAAQKLMSKDQLISLKRNLPHLSVLTEQELGFNICEEMEESLPGTEIATEPSISSQPEAKKSKVPPCWGNIEPEDDDEDELSAEDILAEAQKAAKAAAEKLTLKRPNSKFGFLRQHENGTTTLSILHPKSGERDMKVNLEMLTGKLSQGTGTIIGFKEDSKNIIKPVSYTNYGAYSSYAPHYDSMFSNLNKEESELVITTYGDELGVQYADSILSYARDSDYMMTMVDNLLDVLTGGEHSKTIKILEERRKMKEEEHELKTSDCRQLSHEQKETLQVTAEQAEAESLQALSDIDMEMSLLQPPVETENGFKRKADKSLSKAELLQKHKKLLTQRKAIQQKLDNATQLLQDLRKVQSERLSSTPPSHLSHVQGPGAAESELADKLSKKIADIALQLPPESIRSVTGLRKAMGIAYPPSKSSEKQTVSDTGPSKSILSTTSRKMNVNLNEPTSQRAPIFTSNSPVRATGEDHISDQMDTELQQFLATGPMLRVCDSPTES